MGVYIKGLKLPSAERQGELLILTDDGRCVDMSSEEYEAVELQPHGRLIDADALKEDCRHEIQKAIEMEKNEEDRNVAMAIHANLVWLIHDINHLPTIIEADSDVMFYPQVDGITQTVIKGETEDGT